MNDAIVEQISRQPGWEEYLIISIIGALYVLFGGMKVGRTGHAPFWALLFLIPYVQWIAVWIIAFVAWPRIDKSDDKSK